jgi:hypothetical protein
MSRTVTMSDAQYVRLLPAARRCGLGNMEKLLETWAAA